MRMHNQQICMCIYVFKHTHIYRIADGSNKSETAFFLFYLPAEFPPAAGSAVKQEQ